jgi:hypothetical protein
MFGGLFSNQLAATKADKSWHYGLLVQGWFLRTKDETKTCHEGSRKKPETQLENREDLVAKEDTDQTDPFSRWHQ